MVNSSHGGSIGWRAWVFRLAIGLVAAACLWGLFLAGKGVYRHYVWDNFGVVEEGRIYRSGLLKPHQLHAALARLQLRAVLTLNYYGSPECLEEERIVKEHGARFLRQSWPGDGVVLEEQLRKVHALITNPKNQPILIHCARGTSRTGVVVADYRRRVSGWSREQIRAEMIRYRHRPSSNPRLEEQIDQWFREPDQGQGQRPGTRDPKAPLIPDL